MQIDVRQVSPAAAGELLALASRRNGALADQAKVTRYAAEMTAGTWGDSALVIARSGGEDALVDGKHRCAAIIASGVTVRAVVISGVDPHDKADVELAQLIAWAVRPTAEVRRIVARGAWRESARMMPGACR